LSFASDYNKLNTCFLQVLIFILKAFGEIQKKTEAKKLPANFLLPFFPKADG